MPPADKPLIGLLDVTTVLTGDKTLRETNGTEIRSRAAVTGQPIAWGAWVIALVLCLLGAMLGYAFFQHSREEFADAL